MGGFSPFLGSGYHQASPYYFCTGNRTYSDSYDVLAAFIYQSLGLRKCFKKETGAQRKLKFFIAAVGNRVTVNQ